MEDKEIIRLFMNRSEDAVSECNKKFGAYCRTIAKNILGNNDDTEECVNDAYFTLWNLIPPNSPESLKAFAGKITHNIALNRFRKMFAQKRGGGNFETAFSEFEECITDKISLEETVETKEITKCIEKFLYSQPLEKRNIFIRRYWYMFSVSEISKTYGISESKVKSILFRMRKELKNELEKEGF